MQIEVVLTQLVRRLKYLKTFEVANIIVFHAINCVENNKLTKILSE